MQVDAVICADIEYEEVSSGDGEVLLSERCVRDIVVTLESSHLSRQDLQEDEGRGDGEGGKACSKRVKWRIADIDDLLLSKAFSD